MSRQKKPFRQNTETEFYRIINIEQAFRKHNLQKETFIQRTF